jgi:hypothetical protein
MERKDIYRLHQNDSCIFEAHQHFQSDGYYSLPKPSWKYDCNCPFDAEEQKIVSQLCDMFHLECECSSIRHCTLCRHILREKGKRPQLYISYNQRCHLKSLIRVFREIKKLNIETEPKKLPWSWSFF